jgi:putative membrane protein
VLSIRIHFPKPKTRASWLIGGASLLVALVVAVLLLAPRATLAGRPDVSGLPRLNAVLNAASALALVSGYIFIRRRRTKLHRVCMLAAFGLSALFLFSYVVYHAVAGATRFTGPDSIRPIYFAVLVSHITLAVLVLPLALTTLVRAWHGTFVPHRRIARWTLPVWLYVSMSGVAVYLMLYHLGK